MPKKGLDIKIPNKDERWTGYSRARVEEHLKERFAEKGGYHHYPDEPDAQGRYHHLVFADADSFNDWNTDPEGNAALVLQDLILPASGGGGGGEPAVGVYTQVGLYCDTVGTLVTTDGKVKIGVRFTSTEVDPANDSRLPTGESGTLTVQTRMSGASGWTTQGQIKDFQSVDESQTEKFTAIDISAMVHDGQQQVRLIVKGDNSGKNTRYVQLTVVKASIAISDASTWERPVTDGVMHLAYRITGAVDKTLHILIDGARHVTRELGQEVYTETPLSIAVTDTTADAVKVMTHGLHRVEAWLSVDGSSTESEHCISQVMVVADQTDAAPKLILNSIRERLTNWQEEEFLNYAVYTRDGASVPLTVRLTDAGGAKEYMRLELGNAEPGRRYSLHNQLEIDTELESVEVYMRFESAGVTLHEPLIVTVDNRVNYSPTHGAAFVINPRLHTNNEENPRRIVNAEGGAVIPSTWRGFQMGTSDGWIEDEEGRQCLRVLSGAGLDIDYEPFADFATSMDNSVTVELDVKTRNVTDEEAALLRICTYLPADGLPVGFELKGREGCFMTMNSRELHDQDFGFAEEKRTHIVLNIVHDLNGGGKNLARIFVNGNMYREMAWDGGDSFMQHADGALSCGGIRIGSDSADIDIYGIRIYKSALSATNVLNDYRATLPAIADKEAFTSRNDITNSSGRISYGKVFDRFNTIVYKCKDLPSFANSGGQGKKYKVKGDVTIHIPGQPGQSGTFVNADCEGQGTSSMNWWDWNQRTRKWERFVDENGEEHSGYSLDGVLPECKDVVCKVNWASAMQSHKMGLCNLYNDLWMSIVAPDFVAADVPPRVAVKQIPVMLFHQPEGQGEPVFIGLGTVGPHKGDKPTFAIGEMGYPQLTKEGSDNGMPLGLYQIPWNEDVVLEDDGESVSYGGDVQCEVSMGDAAHLPYFRDAHNFIYGCYPFIEPWEGTLETLRASGLTGRKTMRWVTSAGESADRFDLCRYDTLTGTWVHAGVTKTGAGEYERLNLAAQLGTAPSGTDWGRANADFIALRLERFKAGIGQYRHVKSDLFTKSLLRFFCVSDNWNKNKYDALIRLVDGGVEKILITQKQDDVDTSIQSNNVGRRTKPYYVEEHDVDSEGNPHWNATDNALYNLYEMAMADELRTMMNTIMSSMAAMASGEGRRWSDPVMQTIEDYLLSTQRLFPEVAYNETARVRYETAHDAWMDPNSGYHPSTAPLPQSLGSQLESEEQWLLDRVAYMSSYCSYGNHAGYGGNSLTFRSIVKLDGDNPEYAFTLTPAKWVYPSVNNGTNTVWGQGNAAPVRVKKGETFILDGVTADGNTDIVIHGIDNYSSIGEFHDNPVQSRFPVSGKRLTEFVASKTPMEFRPSSFEVTAENLQTFNVRHVTTLHGGVDLRKAKRIRRIDLRDTGATEYLVSDPTCVEELRLPAGISRLILNDYVALPTSGFELEGYANLTELEVTNCPYLNARDIIAGALGLEGNRLSRVKADGITWDNFSIEMLRQLARIGSDLEGTITLAAGQVLTFADKKMMVERWGDIDGGGQLRIIYSELNVTGVKIVGQIYFKEPGTHRLNLHGTPVNGNSFAGVTWAMEDTEYATINPVTGDVTVTKVGTEAEAPKAKVSATVTLTNGSVLTAEAWLGFYDRSCHVGDYVFADGSYSDVLDGTKTPVAQCFYIAPEHKDRRLAVALKDVSAGAIWGSQGGIDLADNPGYNAYDIQNIPNFGGVGLTTSDGTATGVINDDTIRDETGGDADGFKIQPAASVAGDLGFRQLAEPMFDFPQGAWVPAGLYYTLSAMQHRNLILRDSNIGLSIPTSSPAKTEMQDLMTLMNEAVTKMGSVRYYWPAFSFCYAYEPDYDKTGGEVLADHLKAHNWFLPSGGEMTRLCWYHFRGYTNVADEFAIFAKSSGDGALQMLTNNAYYWSSLERNGGYAWQFRMSAPPSASDINKERSYRVRPVVAF